jgi:outer membrane protein
MKNLQNIAIGLLSVAVVFLLYKQFTDQPSIEVAPGAPTPKESKKFVLAPDSTNKFGAVAFVNTDTLLEQFDSFKKMRASFEKKRDQAERELGTKAQALENEYIEVQRKIQAGTMTETLIKDAEQTLMQKQQSLAMLREQRMNQLMEEEKNLSTRLNDQIFDYMQDYAPAHGLKYVLGYTRGGGILYAADSLDITSAVLQGLNSRYKGK